MSYTCRNGCRGCGRWISVHLFVSSPDDYLVGYLGPWLQTEHETGRLRHFFFIRYGAGSSVHLRLRFVPCSTDVISTLRTGLENSIVAYDSGASRSKVRGADSRLEESPYCRLEHYFGDNRVSVHAELLNESTSWLALEILRQRELRTRSQRWVALAAVTDMLLGQADSLADARARVMRAAGEIWRRAGRRGRAEVRDEGFDRLADIVFRARHRTIGGYATDPLVLRAGRMLARMLRMPDPGPEAGVHGLHLLWNKTGFSLAEEQSAFGALCALGAHQRSESAEA